MTQARQVADGLRRALERSMRRLTTELHARLVPATPIDTGWARVNWVPRIGAAFEGTAGTRAQAEAGTLDRAPAQSGLSDVAGYVLVQGDIHITNNVPYIELLNAGSSRQAPAAFVQKEIAAAIAAETRRAR